MAITKLSFTNRNRGKQPRANIFLRAGRMLRRKRVAIARAGAAQAMQRAAREAGRLAHIAHVYAVPINPMDPLPAVPALPSQDWIEFRRAMGELRDPVRQAEKTVLA